MANAKKCDRCKKYYDKNTYKKSKNTNRFTTGVTIVFDNHYTDSAYNKDLCDDCIRKFQEFMDGKYLEGEIG